MNPLATIGIRSPRRTLLTFVLVGICAVGISAQAAKNLTVNETEFSPLGTQSEKTSNLLARALGAKKFPNFTVLIPLRPIDDGALTMVKALERFHFALTPGGINLALAEPRNSHEVAIIPQEFYSRNKQEVAFIGYIPEATLETAGASLVPKLRRYPGVLVGGFALVAQQFIDESRHDLLTAELIVFPFVLLLSLIVFRSIAAACVLILTGGLALSIALLTLVGVNYIYHVSIFSFDVAAVLTVALSLDYSLLLITRYREELARGLSVNAAARNTVTSAGRAATISSATVALAFISLFVFPMGFLRSLALGGVVAAAVAGLVSLVILPATMTLLGDRLNIRTVKLRHHPAMGASHTLQAGGWYKLARTVIAHPAAIAIMASCALLAMSGPALGMHLTGFSSASLPPGSAARLLDDRLEAEFAHPLVNEVIAVAHGTPHAIHELTSQYIAKLPQIAVREVTPVSRSLWMFNLRTHGAPFSSGSERLVHDLRKSPYHLSVTGTTANYLDTVSTLWSHLPLALAILLSTTLVCLFMATGSVILPLKAIAMNTLSLAAAFGLLVFIFQGDFLVEQVIWIAVGAFGVLTDYSVFLLTRIREGHEAGLSNDEAVARGLEHSGRTISGAALLFCVAVGVLIIARLQFVKEVGFGLAVAVAVDAAIVRALLVPSLMALLGRWNWWAPSPLGSLWRRIGMSTDRRPSERGCRSHGPM